ncbi:MAG: ATP-binding cassette domain-containing protein [Pseudobdellovibrionaceae bacterium]|nr:ATP-binding cassette domain-containing protein [Bdellovibrionales bacterium]USN48874.1 MAG: ATP-binding cassette domain-containing protein [Pseudobdellovibrionaceae bacterium]
MIQVSDLSKSYGDRLAIDRLNFSVRKGEVVGFLGPNGAGKSTTMKIITGFMAPSSGSVKVAGFDVFENPIEVKQRIGYLPELPPVYGDMYVRDYLKFAALLKRVPRKKVNSLVDAALEKTGLQDVHKRLIQNLSKGYRQRVGLAQALVSDPDILILDEPTVGLDPKQMAEIRKLIQNLKGQHTIILSTHILPEVQANCERIIIINKGKIVAEDSLQGLSNRLSGNRRVTVRVRRSADELVNTLQQVSGVSNIGRDQDGIHIDIDQNEDTIEAIADHVVQKRAGLLELRSDTMGLEDIFIKLTSSEGAMDARGEV